MENASKLERLLSYYKQDPGNENLVKEVLSQMGEQRSTEQLESFFKQLSSEMQSSPSIVWHYGRIMVDLGQLQTATQLFASLPDDENETKPYSLALCLFLQSRFEEAQDVLANYLAKIGQYSSAQLAVLDAKIKYHLGDIQGALDLAEQINKQYQGTEQSNPELLGLLAMLNLDAFQIEKSEAYTRQLLSLLPKHHDGLLAKASIHLYKQELSEASEVANTGVSEFANSGRMWSVLAQSLFAMGDKEAAYNCVKNATKLMQNHIGTWHIQAWCELVKDDYTSANESFNQALALNKNFGETHAGIALVAFHQEEYERAEKSMKIAQRLDPNGFTAAYVKSMFLSKQGKQEESKALIDGILSQPSHLSGLTYKQLINNLQR